MTQTKLMRADEIVSGFNTVVERKYWKAAIAGTRTNPEVHFNSRASMVRVVHRLATDDFTVVFNRSNAAFGDFLASVHRSMIQILASLKAAGLPFEASADAVLRIEYSATTKAATVHIATPGSDWLNAEPMSFIVPKRNNIENTLPAIDGL